MSLAFPMAMPHASWIIIVAPAAIARWSPAWAMTQNNLGNALHEMIDAMIKRKLVVRERDSEDARARSLHLTPKGEALVDRAIPLAQMYERVALAGITAEQAKAAKAEAAAANFRSSL